MFSITMMICEVLRGCSLDVLKQPGAFRKFTIRHAIVLPVNFFIFTYQTLVSFL